MKEKITVIGAGAYGLALANTLSKKKNRIIYIWTENEPLFDEFSKKNTASKLFPNIKFSKNIHITKDYQEALDNTNMILIASATKYIPNICCDISKYYKNTPICIASKGIEHKSLSTLSDLVKGYLKTNNITVISGPTFAIDLINNEPCALAIAGFNKKTINYVKSVLENETLKLRVSTDLLGIQICGSIKNIVAIAAGILKGLGYSESTQAFLINESLHDIKKTIKYLGGKGKTILSFAGVGDILLTCSSSKSRNYSFGYVIGNTKNKKKIDEYLKENTVEGYYTLESVYKLLKKKNINIPLINLIYDIVFNNKDPEVLARFLITKD